MKVATIALIAAAASAPLAAPVLAGSLDEATTEPVIQPVAPTPVVTQSGDWTGAYGGVTLSYGDISSSPARPMAMAPCTACAPVMTMTSARSFWAVRSVMTSRISTWAAATRWTAWPR